MLATSLVATIVDASGGSVVQGRAFAILSLILAVVVLSRVALPGAGCDCSVLPALGGRIIELFAFFNKQALSAPCGESSPSLSSVVELVSVLGGAVVRFALVADRGCSGVAVLLIADSGCSDVAVLIADSGCSDVAVLIVDSGCSDVAVLLVANASSAVTDCVCANAFAFCMNASNVT